MNTSQILIISTAHLSDTTNALLASTDCMDWPSLGGPYRDVGWIFHVDEDAAYDFESPSFQDLYAVFRYAIERDVFIVLFCDIAEPVAGLPVFRDPARGVGNPFLYGKNVARGDVTRLDWYRLGEHPPKSTSSQG